MHFVFQISSQVCITFIWYVECCDLSAHFTISRMTLHITMCYMTSQNLMCHMTSHITMCCMTSHITLPYDITHHHVRYDITHQTVPDDITHHTVLYDITHHCTIWHHTSLCCMTSHITLSKVMYLVLVATCRGQFHKFMYSTCRLNKLFYILWYIRSIIGGDFGGFKDNLLALVYAMPFVSKFKYFFQSFNL